MMNTDESPCNNEKNNDCNTMNPTPLNSDERIKDFSCSSTEITEKTSSKKPNTSDATKFTTKKNITILGD